MKTKKIVLGIIIILATVSCQKDDIQNNKTFNKLIDLPEYEEKFISIIGQKSLNFQIGDGYDLKTNKIFKKTVEGETSKSLFSTINFIELNSPDIYSKEELIARLKLDEIKKLPTEIKSRKVKDFTVNYSPEIRFLDAINKLSFERSITIVNKKLVEGYKNSIHGTIQTIKPKKGNFYVSGIQDMFHLYYIEHYNIEKDADYEHFKELLEKKYCNLFCLGSELENNDLTELENDFKSRGIKCTKIIYSSSNESEISKIHSLNSFKSFINNSKTNTHNHHLRPLKISFTEY